MYMAIRNSVLRVTTSSTNHPQTAVVEAYNQLPEVRPRDMLPFSLEHFGVLLSRRRLRISS